jgi:hypothetical protein
MFRLKNYPLATLATAFLGLIAGCEGKSGGVPAEAVADYIHTVIDADRKTYVSAVVDRLQNVDNVIKASEHFKEDKALPLPVQMVLMGSQRASEKGAFRYFLKSLWPINKANGPKTDAEKAGLEAIVKNPDAPYRSYQTIDGKKYLLAIYPEKAVSLECVQCHNNHKESPRRDQVLGGVMGGIAIYVPMD